jgi:hypothetical protein
MYEKHQQLECHRRRTGQQGALAKQRRSKHLQSRKEGDSSVSTQEEAAE